MADRFEKIAELYYRSNSVKFGDFELSIHQDHSELPKSPWYLHYPKPGEPGYELLGELQRLIGLQFFSMIDLGDVPDKITGLPNGATQLGVELAKQYDNYPENHIEFVKTTPDQTD